MEDIRIYHSIWKNIALMAVCFVFVAMGIFILLHGEQSFTVWSGILFFGGGGLFVLFLILKERITHTPYYMITDDGIIMNSGLVVPFAASTRVWLVHKKLSPQMV